MPKFKIKVKTVDGTETEQEIELTNEQIAEVAKKDAGLAMDVLGAAGFSFEKGPTSGTPSGTPQPPTQSGVDGGRLDRIEKAIETITGVVGDVKKRMDEDATHRQTQQQSELETKAKTLVDKAVSEGRIPHGDRDQTLKDAMANFEFTARWLERLKPDPAVAKTNAVQPATPSGAQQPTTGAQPAKPVTPSGAPSFRTSEIAKMSSEEFAKNEAAIMEAMKNDAIIED